MAAETEVEQDRSSRNIQYLFVAYVVVSLNFDIVDETQQISDSDPGLPVGLYHIRQR